jgi:hypothetical protein
VSEECLLLTGPECAAYGGTYAGDFTECGPGGACPPATGACCLPDPPFCEILTYDACDEAGGSFLGAGSTCDDCTFEPDTGTVNGQYVISLCGVEPASPDCNLNGIADIIETAPEFDPDAVDPGFQDICADAEWICPGTFSGTSVGATPPTAAYLSCGDFVAPYDVFYKYRPESDATVSVAIDGGGTWLVSAHTDCPPSETNGIACSDPPGTATFDVIAGQTYWIRVGRADAPDGNFLLTVDGPPCAPNPIDLNGNGIPDECECPTDVAPAEGDGVTNLLDFVAVLNAFGPCPACPEDVDLSGVVDNADLQLVVAAMGGPCANGGSSGGPSGGVTFGKAIPH